MLCCITSTFNLILLLSYFSKFQALNRIGFRVVLDVVYNHLHGSGPFDENSVLDKVISEFLCSISTLLFIL